MMPEPEENRLDQSLRDKFEDFDLTPSAPVWAGIAQRLPPPPQLRRRRRPVLLPLLFVLTALLAGLGGWLLPRAGRVGAARAASEASEAVSASRAPMAAPATPGAPRTDQTAHRIGILRETAAATAPTVAAAPATPSGELLRRLRPTPQAKQIARTAIQPRIKDIALQLPVAATKAEPTKPQTAPETSTIPTAPDSKPAAAAAATVEPTPERIPATLHTLAALERQTLEQLPSIFTLAPGTPLPGSRPALAAALRAERAELLRLQRRADSLLLALGEVLPAAALATAPAAAAAPDTTRTLPTRHRWSVLLTATPEQNTLTLQGPENNPLTALRRNHETGRAGLNAALMAEYQLAPRLSVGGGVGYSTYGADLRITNKTTAIFVKYDSTTTYTTNAYVSTSQTHSIRIIQVPQLSPVFNGSGQVIRYDTVYVPRQDTVFTTIVQHDTVRTTRKVLTPLISKKETLSTKLLQPNYRFFTVPVLLRYRLTMGPGRWWADVSVGAQLQFFLGGTQVVTDDGENFRTETITAGNGPFRALNVGLSGALALNYALTNRLSVSVAPSMRWQALSVYKPETGLIQQPTATGLQLGVRFRL